MLLEQHSTVGNDFMRQTCKQLWMLMPHSLSTASNGLDRLQIHQNFRQLWGLSLNSRKTVVMQFSGKPVETSLHIKFGSERQPEVTYFRYLGCEITQDCSSLKMATARLDKVDSMAGMLAPM